MMPYLFMMSILVQQEALQIFKSQILATCYSEERLAKILVVFSQAKINFLVFGKFELSSVNDFLFANWTVSTEDGPILAGQLCQRLFSLFDLCAGWPEMHLCHEMMSDFIVKLKDSIYNMQATGPLFV